MKNSGFLLLIAVLFCALCVSAKEPKQKDTPITLKWPPAPAAPTLNLVFSKFEKLAAYNGQNSLSAELTVQNVSDKLIPRASFTVYFYDSQKVRIGETAISIEDLKAGQSAKYPMQFFCVGLPSSLELQARTDAHGIPRSTKNVSLKVITVPPGAALKVDGQPAEGVTPKLVYLSVGTHTLEVSKDGYATGSTPVEITADELPGGSITIEMGGLSRDTVELRDGTMLLGDVMSMSLTEVDMNVNGESKKIERNRVKKMILVEREVTIQQLPAQPPASK